MANYKKETSHASEYTRIYSGMRGVDFTGDGSRIAQDRFAYLENMYRDYDGEGAALTESLPGFRKLYDFGSAIHGIFRHRAGGTDYVLVHAGTKLYRFPVSGRDAITSPTQLITLADHDSRGFAYGENFYILDGTSYTEVNSQGQANRVSRTVGRVPYLPTLYKNGEPYEQRNILTDEFSEEIDVTVPELYAFGSEGLLYESDPDVPGCVALVGASTTVTDLYIPAYVEFEGAKCAVSAVASGAFASNSTLTAVRAAGGIAKIKDGAFASCPALTTVSLPDTLTHLGAGAFASCTALSSFTIGKGLAVVGENVLSGCSRLSAIRYGGSAADITAITGGAALHAVIPFLPGQRDASIKIKIPICADALSVSYLYVNGSRVSGVSHAQNGRVDYLTYTASDRKTLVGANVKLYGILAGTANSNGIKKSDKGDFFACFSDYTGTQSAVITACTICTVFDGRIFFSGNPSFPGTVFYAERDDTGKVNPTYFGAFDYFTDGVGPSPVTSLLAVRDTLAVFRKDDDGGGSIFYHSPKETGDSFLSKIYPVGYVHHGLLGIGASLSFFDDSVFVTGQGVCALEKRSESGERFVVCRSHNVSDKLLTENLQDAILTKWAGYLCLLTGSHLYLGDSRQTFTHATGNTEYEWYYATGIGSYQNDTTVYRYSSQTEAGCDETKTPDEAVLGTVQTETVGGILKYYVTDGTKKYRVYPTEEKTGGTFTAACALESFDKYLFFGTVSGALCLFNNDMRGVAPSYLSSASDFDAAEYAEKFGRRIHPYYYANDNHPMHFVLKTAMDNGGMPHLSKDTVKHSLVIKCKDAGAKSLICEVRTDREGFKTVTAFPEGSFSFAELNFSSLTMDTEESFTVPIDEKSKNWIEKQVGFYADGYASPIGIFSIAYRYRVRGKIKKI